jgi:hypothetical protein
MWRSTLLSVLLLPCLTGLTRAGDEEDFWRDFRNRQRKEVESLAKPAEPPAGNGSAIDRFVAAEWAAQKFTPAAVVGDRAFARRVYFDIIGLPPTVEQLDAFERESAPDKRTKLVDTLLADKVAFAEHWMTFWNDLLRNDEQTNIDGLRKPITGWLFSSLRDNEPVDQMVAELLNPGKNGPDGYLKGVNWRGRVNASQTPPIQAAQNVSQVFLASSLKCASCHDSFINNWKLDQAYGLASFFSDTNLEMHRCDKPTGKVVAPKFLFADMGDIADNANLVTRHRAVAQMVTRPKNPRFAKTMVNRYWKQLLGRGLFEPADDFEDGSAHTALVGYLAHDFMSHDYDAKYLIRQIVLSKVYQLPVTQAKAKKVTDPPPLFGPVTRRLTSEQYLDAVAQVTGHWPTAPTMQVRVDNAHIRAWRHKKPDNVATALGRPNREQVCTERNQESTVLQALELVNGTELATRLKEGAKVLLASELGKEADTAKVAKTLYLRSLGREPNDEEMNLAKSMLGSAKDEAAKRQPGWEDFLWILVMSPEFQFVR